jgi:hypothetical protein
MSQDAIATWHAGELPLISTDTDSFDLASAERTPRRPQFSAAVHDSAARDLAEALSVSHADATDTDTAAPGFLDELHNARIRTAMSPMRSELMIHSAITACCKFSMRPPSAA